MKEIRISHINYHNQPRNKDGHVDDDFNYMFLLRRHVCIYSTIMVAQILMKSSGDDLTVKRLGELWKRHAKEGFIRQEGPADDPFESIPTRSPPLSLDSEERQYSRRKHHRGLNDYYQKYPREYDQYSSGQQNAVLYRVYPGLHPKDTSFCSDMRGMFAFTCQPSKPLRIDLVEFCKIGHVGVSGKFGFGIGAVPGLDVGVGWGVDVGPIPGMGESVGVDLGEPPPVVFIIYYYGYLDQSPSLSDRTSSREDSPSSRKLQLDDDGCPICPLCGDKMTDVKDSKLSEPSSNAEQVRRKRELELLRIRNNQHKRLALKRGTTALIRDSLTPFSRQSNDESGSSGSPEVKKEELDTFGNIKCFSCQRTTEYGIVSSSFEHPRCQECFDSLRNQAGALPATKVNYKQFKKIPLN
uniref:Nuclear receptor domain-containing protein n=1 Tax=Heterorhabditis bacteriophora TaxID=37862 RepID=A0A1I7XQE5_HETBA